MTRKHLRKHSNKHLLCLCSALYIRQLSFCITEYVYYRKPTRKGSANRLTFIKWIKHEQFKPLYSFKSSGALVLLQALNIRVYSVTQSKSSSANASSESNNPLSYSSFETMLKAENIIVDPSEVQGILCGMLAGGMNLDDQNWLEALADVINQGDALSTTAQQNVVLMFNQICQEFIEADFALRMCLPSDASSINVRGAALVNWVHGFLLGFGLHQDDLTKCSEEAKEALEDFAQISKLDEDMEEGEESEQAFFEVIEYVRISAMLCFNEMGKSLIDSRQQSPVIH